MVKFLKVPSKRIHLDKILSIRSSNGTLKSQSFLYHI